MEEVWICHATDGKWRMQHSPDKGTVKAYAYTDGCTPLGHKEWGVWSGGVWGEQKLRAVAVSERPEATQLADRLFHRTCKILRSLSVFDGVIAPPPLQRIAFTALVDPVLVPHIRAQRSSSVAITKARHVLECLPEAWFKFGTPEVADTLVQCVRTLRTQSGIGDMAQVMYLHRRLNIKLA